MKPYFITFDDGFLVYSSDYIPSAEGISYSFDSEFSQYEQENTEKR